MKYSYLIIFFFYSYFAFSQDVSIKTKFIEEGFIYKNIDKPEISFMPFKENEKCFVLDYLGRNIYKVMVGESIGYVSDDFLSVNEEMMDLFYDYEDKERLKAIEEDNDRKRKIAEAVKKVRLKKEKIQDSIRLIEEAKERLLKYRQDSIAQVKADLLRKQKEELVRLTKKKQDSIAKVQLANEKERLALERKLEKERKDQIRRDSIIKVEQERKLQAEQKARALAARIAQEQKEKRQRDSIAKVQLAKEKERLALERKLEKERKEQKRRDSIIKVEQERKLQVEQNASALAVRIKQEQREREVQDSILRVEQERKIQQEKALAKIDEERRQRIFEKIKQKEAELKEKKRLDSLSSVQQIAVEDKVSLDDIKKRNTCEYQINEFDQFYGIKTIRTESYEIGEGLIVELYRQNRKKNVFFTSQIDLGCVSYLPNQRSTVSITLENNQVIKLYHSWDIQCGEFLFKGDLTTAKMSALSKSSIKSILLKGTKGSFEITNIIYKTFFIDKLKCIE